MVDVFVADQLTSQVMNLAQANYINYFQRLVIIIFGILIFLCLYGNSDPIIEAYGVCFLLLLNKKLQDP